MWPCRRLSGAYRRDQKYAWKCVKIVIENSPLCLLALTLTQTLTSSSSAATRVLKVAFWRCRVVITAATAACGRGGVIVDVALSVYFMFRLLLLPRTRNCRVYFFPSLLRLRLRLRIDSNCGERVAAQTLLLLLLYAVGRRFCFCFCFGICLCRCYCYSASPFALLWLSARTQGEKYIEFFQVPFRVCVAIKFNLQSNYSIYGQWVSAFAPIFIDIHTYNAVPKIDLMNQLL